MTTLDQPLATWRGLFAAARRPLFLIGVTTVYVVLLWLLAPDPPESEGCYVGTDTSQIAHYRLAAFPLTVVWGVVLAAAAWTWASERQAARGEPRRPGRVALGISAAYWGLLIIGSLSSNSIHTGGPFDFQVMAFLALPAVIVIPVALVVDVVVIGIGRLRRTRSWRAKVESATVFLAWSTLVLGFPLVLGAIGAAGYGCD